MTRAQETIIKYIRQNFIDGSIKINMVDLDKVRITDHNGDRLTLTLNLYCDILDVETGQLYAISNLPHDILSIGTKMPTAWEELPR